MSEYQISSKPTTIVIFGASGDLTRRKLIPALFNEYRRSRLPDHFHIVGSSRRSFSHEEFRERMLEGLKELAGIEPAEDEWDEFSRKIWYLPGDVNEIEDYKNLVTFLEERESRAANRLFYLATAPNLFPEIVKKLGELNLASEKDEWRRLVIEKPFGRDLSSAHHLNEQLHQVFEEHQIYRIDHYLGKDTAQNILYFRFLNTIFEPVWNRNYIDHVQITVAEKVDVGHRAGYYDTAGVLRDMFQNHLLQLLTLLAMEPPARVDADAVRNEKVKVLQAVRAVSPENVIQAQYDGYCEAKGVAENSQTPTYAAVKLYIDNWRWKGVPFYLRSGKAMAQKTTEVVIEFESPPHVMFDLREGYELTPNVLSLCIQPDEGIHFRFETKVPGSPQETRSVNMEFHYSSYFGDDPLPDAYQRLLSDALSGDASLFTRSDEIEVAWRIMDPILESWQDTEGVRPTVSYSKGSWGPEEADEFLARDGRIWRLGCVH
jgi:glucose-6-phosphate 1-dehydrogenase